MISQLTLPVADVRRVLWGGRCSHTLSKLAHPAHSAPAGEVEKHKPFRATYGVAQAIGAANPYYLGIDLSVNP